ncbi:GH92 family glycosyl hydrolase [Dysgonomonas sp. 25]|uniref:GH92 family glycosyl hydrolase n=1 Tax=Dysgonomonas sp. 25 TaxID=2302933 RepID=UPI0021077A40|nr:GH92 family glycosyl hydrolase [Dysgonomonas sp. 25]
MLKKTAITLFTALAAATFICSCEQTEVPQDQDLTQYVDLYIGTGDHGHVFMGADVPYGMVQLGPSSITEGWDWVSGYHYSDSIIFGFSHTHLNGTGIGDLQDILFTPTVGDVKLAKGVHNDQKSGYYSLFRRETEKAKPGYYAVHLDRYNVDVELTATNRVGFHKYIFPASDASAVVINLADHMNWDKPTEGYLVQENDSVISGYRYSEGWANKQRLYFTAVFSKPMKQFEVADAGKAVSGTSLTAEKVYGVAKFDTQENEEIYVKVALSPVSIENAKLNMQAELAGWDFEQVIKDADKAWNAELNKIQIQTTDEQVKRIFYTALYHTMVAPSTFQDVNGDYRGSDGKTYEKADFKNYTTFSLWDTYRAAHPLMTIIHPEKVNDMINTMLHIYQQQGKLPVWHLVGCETDCMVGNPGVIVVADAILKGYAGFDKELAYEAMKNSMLLDERGLGYYKEFQYIPYDKEDEALSKAMEYAIADWSLAQVAKEMGKTEDYEYFSKRSKVYQHYFDKEKGFVRGLSSEGNFRPNFDPFAAPHREGDYVEGNAWQYTWLVPHDIAGLVESFGSKDKFVTKLDSLFTVKGNLGEGASPDISGLIGQYAHGNEPSHHVLYMYPYVGQPWKTADKVREVLYVLYHDQPAGLSGNEDVGQMSAWYVLSAMGFYQVEPAGGKYIFGSPILDEAVVRVKGGKIFTITAHNNSKDNKYIQSVKLNGKDYDKFYIDFKAIEAGGTLEFFMGDKPSDTWGINDEVIK